MEFLSKQGKVLKSPIFVGKKQSLPAWSPRQYSQRKKKGFGSAEERFIYNDDNSGPEFYNKVDPANPSFSKKGCGSLINKESRFKRFRYYTPVPGPGNYNLQKPRRSLNGMVYKPSKRKSQESARKSPAPGDYNPQYLDNTRIPMSANFTSKSKRDVRAVNINPAPWDYSPEITKKQIKGPVYRTIKSTRRHLINLYDPHNEVKPEVLPGPGEYNVALNIRNLNKCSTFVKSPRNLNKSRINDQIGPGSYILETNETKKSPVKDPVFMSGSERTMFMQEGRPPGPAFYEPLAVPKKKSFHLNSNNRWM